MPNFFQRSLSVSLSVANLIVMTNMLNDEQTNNKGVLVVFNVLIVASLHLHMVVPKLQTGVWRRHAHFYRCISTGKAVRHCTSMILYEYSQPGRIVNDACFVGGNLVPIISLLINILFRVCVCLRVREDQRIA